MTCQEKRLRRQEKNEAKCRRRQEKREAKYLRRQEKREAKLLHREAKREAKLRHREEKRQAVHQICEDFWNSAALLFNPSTWENNNNNNNNINNNNSNHHNNNYNNNMSYPNIRYNNNFNEMSPESPEKIERDVATLRTMFPDCDPEYIRNCLFNETEDHLRRVAEKLLRTDYPKVSQASHLTPPTAPPLPVRNSFEFPFDNEAPPSYEQALLQPPPLPKRHQRASSWNGTSITLPQSHQSHQSHQSQQSQQSQQPQQSRRSVNISTELNESINTAVKNLFSNFKPSTVESAYQKYSYIWTRPVSDSFNPQPFPQPFTVSPKDKCSIQKGFNPDDFPTRNLYSHHISESDWSCFINGLNSLIGVNSVYGGSNNFGENFHVGLKWVSWMNVTMNEKMMNNNISSINEYIIKCNESFFIPRRIMVQLVDDKTPKPARSSFGFKIKDKKPSSTQYLLVTSI